MCSGYRCSRGCTGFCVNESCLSLRHPVFKLDGEAIQRSFPVPYRHRPLLADVVQGKIKQLADSFIGRKELRALVTFRRLMLIDSIAFVVYITLRISGG